MHKFFFNIDIKAYKKYFTLLSIENPEWNLIVVGKNEVSGVKFDNDRLGVIEVCIYDYFMHAWHKLEC